MSWDLPVIKCDAFNLFLLRRRATRRKSCVRLTVPRPSWPPAAMMVRSSCGTWFLGVCSVASSALLQMSSNTLMVMSDLVNVNNRYFSYSATIIVFLDWTGLDASVTSIIFLKNRKLQQFSMATALVTSGAMGQYDVDSRWLPQFLTKHC